jgi:thiol-disulfide isomerase/thioredoxin
MLALTVLALTLAPQAAPTPTLFVGDPAPPFAVERWLRGEPRTALELGKVHVVEFWTTWCGPCIAGMPHLSKLQRELGPRGLQVIGVAPRPDEWGHDLASIEALLERKRDVLAYDFALDAESDSKDGYHDVFHGRTIESWMGAASVGAIPIAFVVDREGKLAAIAPPNEIDDVVRACLDGTFNRARAAAEYRALLAARAQLDEVQRLIETGERELAFSLSEELLAGPLWRDGRSLGALADRWQGDGGAEARALALKAAQRAAELTQFGEPGTLGLLARLRLRNGERAEAERLQALALALAEGELRAALEREFAKVGSAR